MYIACGWLKRKTNVVNRRSIFSQPVNAGSVRAYYNWKTFLFTEHLDTGVCARILAKGEKKQQKELQEKGKQMATTAMFNKTL